MKIGQWARTNRGIFIIDDISEVSNKVGISTYKGQLLNAVPDEVIIAIADKPTELVQVGDLVRDNYYGLLEIESISANLGDYEPTQQIEELFYKDNITEIWTRTSDNTYTRQWKKEE